MDKPPIADVLRHYGAEDVPAGNGWRSMRCPFHDDRHASASVNHELDKFSCQGCGMSGDSFDIIQDREGCEDFPSTQSSADELFGTSNKPVSKSAKSEPRRRGVFEEPRIVAGQRDIFSVGVRRRPLSGA